MDTKMMKAFWFSRHTPTEAQVQELESLGYELIVNDASYQLGNIELTNDDTVAAVLIGILSVCDLVGAKVCAGVFPVPIAQAAMRTADEAIAAGDYLPGTITLMAAWNVNRAAEGGRPTFEHKRFCRVGILHFNALR
ncbi:MAG: hypothetical protein PHS31_05560 [Victivallaceae bacterium]|nr:hypothetical protein [Victivallaceae bacterium]MDD4182142.1 hypothetical protein [Victivallaceae bacterium]